MSSLWARYKREQAGTTFIEEPWGFVSYSQLDQDILFVEDVYVVPAERASGRTRELLAKVEEMARLEKRTLLMGVVCLTSQTATESIKMQLALGFVPFKADLGKIWFKRSVGGS